MSWFRGKRILSSRIDTSGEDARQRVEAKEIRRAAEQRLARTQQADTDVTQALAEARRIARSNEFSRRLREVFRSVPGTMG